MNKSLNKFEIKQHFNIESARKLPHLPSTHPCSQVHGHSFKIIIQLVGELDSKIGWLIDYNDVHKIMDPFIKQLDHKLLNDIPGLENPTSELIAKWIYDQTYLSFQKASIELKKVSVLETPLTECAYPAS